jgi:histidinol-phosphate/aromatic aminotransferase/cobyric acid decarboxylase-like protein
MLVKVSNPEKFINHLKQNKILIRDRSYLVCLSGYVRFTIGTIDDMKKVIGVIKNYE